MADFKVGDRVTCIAKSGFGFPGDLGMEYTVAYVTLSGAIILDGFGKLKCEPNRFKLVARSEEKPAFKPGDRVRLVEDCGYAKVGAIATVTDHGVFGKYIDIRFDRNGLDGGMADGGYSLGRFVLVSSKSTTATPPVSAQVDAINEEYGPAPATNVGGHAIVCVMKKGKPRPSSQPFVHHNQAAAVLEADRLAKKHAGEQFGVYVLAETRRIDHPHEWQRLALNGQRGAAIRIIQDLTGLPVDQARLAVNAWADRA